MAIPGQTKSVDSDIVIIGGGIIGLMTARALAREGFGVTVLERGRLGAQASRAAGGILCPLYPWRLPDAMQALTAQAMASYPDVVRELERESGLSIRTRLTGLILLDDSEFSLARDWAERWSIACESLSPNQLGAREPALGDKCGGLLFPEMRNVYAGELVDAAAESCRRHGVVIRESASVEDICLAGSGEVRVDTATDSLRPDRLVIAGGAWSSLLLERLGGQLAVRPVRGQILQYGRGSSRLAHMVLSGRKYLVPRPGGELIIGSTLEEVGFDATTTAAGHQELKVAAESILPELADQEVVSHWAGLRPGAPDHLPFIGLWREALAEGGCDVLLNTGHYQNGILLAPLSAELLTTAITAEPGPMNIAPFDPRRCQECKTPID